MIKSLKKLFYIPPFSLLKNKAQELGESVKLEHANGSLLEIKPYMVTTDVGDCPSFDLPPGQVLLF